MNLKRLKSGMRTLHPVRLDDWSLTDDDLAGELVTKKGSPLLFGYFPASRVLGDFEARGMLARIRERGYSDFELRSEADGSFENRVRLYARHASQPEPCLLMDMRTHRGELCGASAMLGREVRFRGLIWEWLSFQDPLRSFPEGTEALPGQDHPGLGVFRPALELMLEYVGEMDVEALVGLPQFFHNAVLYSDRFHFFLPSLEGEFHALRRDLIGEGLARCSQALRDGQVIQRESGRQIRWHAAEQVRPLKGDILEHFRHPGYAAEVQRVAASSHYRLM